MQIYETTGTKNTLQRNLQWKPELEIFRRLEISLENRIKMKTNISPCDPCDPL